LCAGQQPVRIGTGCADPAHTARSSAGGSLRQFALIRRDRAESADPRRVAWNLP
jgi:hypothetical protein